MAVTAPVNENTDLVTTTLLINGVEIESSYQVFSIEITKEVNRVTSASITILDGDPASGDFPASDSTDFVPGSEVTIKAGYHSTEAIVFTGIIVKHAIKLREHRSPMLILDCRDKSIKMTVGRFNNVYENMTDSSIISQVIGKYGLAKAVDSTSYTNKELVQYYCTDWDFMIARAEANGLIVLTEQGKVTVAKPDESQAAVLELTYGENIFSFDAETDSRNQYNAVQTNAWDPKQQALLTATAKNPPGTGPGNFTYSELGEVSAPATLNLQSTAPLEQDDIQNWADAYLLKSRFSKVNGKIRFQGNSTVLPGKTVELAGMGARFNGIAFVSSVVHTIEKGHWNTTVGLGLSPAWFTETQKEIMAPAASGILPGIQGLQIGVVKKTNEDPDKEFRVQVAIPVLNNKTVWARLSNLYATSAAGSFFYPEVNDEVVLGFFNNDPRFPVIVGSLYSSSRAPAYTPDDKNKTKAIVSNSKVKIEIDEEKKSITITTPGNNTVVLSDDAKSITMTDQNSNKIELSQSGILIQSPKNITIKATQNVEVSATANVDVKATQGLKLAGLTINGNAQTQLKMEGTTSEVSGAAMLTLKGGMVMIN